MRTWRDRIIDLLSVTAITVVVWLYASGQTLQSRTISFDVVVESGDAARVATATPEVVHASLEISGSRQALIRASESLSGRIVRLRTGADGVPAQPGEHDVPLRDVLERAPAVAALGVDITTVSPSVVRITIEAAKEAAK
jgi:hypothetical protein